MADRQGGAKPALLRELNGGAVLDVIRTKGPLSRAQIADILGLSRPTVSRAVDHLLVNNLVQEIGEGSSTGGRKPILLRFNQNAGCVVGVDLGGTTTSCGVADLGGNFITRLKVANRAAEGRDAALSALVDAVRSALARVKPVERSLLAIGVGCPGVMDPETRSLRLAPNHPGLDQVPLAQVLEDAFGVPVAINNDVNAAAIGEHWRGAARSLRHVVFLSVGTGIGAGLLIDGKPFLGATGAAGEIGYMAFDRRGLETREHGFLESMASEYGIRRASRHALDSGQIFQLAKAGDAEARRIIDQMTDYLALAIQNMVSLLNPEAVVLGGALMLRNPELLEDIRRKFEQFAAVPVGLTLSQLGEDAALCGAVKQALDLVFANLNCTSEAGA